MTLWRFLTSSVSEGCHINITDMFLKCSQTQCQINCYDLQLLTHVHYMKYENLGTKNEINEPYN